MVGGRSLEGRREGRMEGRERTKEEREKYDENKEETLGKKGVQKNTSVLTSMTFFLFSR